MIPRLLVLFLLIILLILWNYVSRKIRRHENRLLRKKFIYKKKKLISLPFERPYRTILIVFAGRQDRMSILNLYVLFLLKTHLIDEYHIWNLTRQVKDEEWLRKWVHKNPSQKRFKIRLFEPPIKQYKSVYEHYISHANQFSSKDVFIKLDDDIIYLQVLVVDSDRC